MTCMAPIYLIFEDWSWTGRSSNGWKRGTQPAVEKGHSSLNLVLSWLGEQSFKLSPRQAKLGESFKLLNHSNWPVTLKNRSRSLIIKLSRGLMGMHPLEKFELSGLKFFHKILQKSQTRWIMQIPLWSWKIGPVQWPSNLVKVLWGCIIWTSLSWLGWKLCK